MDRSGSGIFTLPVVSLCKSTTPLGVALVELAAHAATDIIFFHEADAESRLLTIAAIGNPIPWWSSTLAVALSLGELVRRKVIARKPAADHPLVPILLGYTALLLPWVTGTRVAFLYHYLPSYAFALLALVYWLC